MSQKIDRTKYIPKYVYRLLDEINKNDMTQNQQTEVFLSHMYKMKLRGKTINDYFKIIKPKYFPEATIIPDELAFDKLKPPQNRNVNFKAFDNLIKYIFALDNENKFKWPLLFCYYTGLRLNELFQIKPIHLIMLTNKEKTIPIIRKKGERWNVLYYEIFENFINQLRHFIFKYECDNNVDYLILFKNISKWFLNEKMKIFYIIANDGLTPRLGFGIHLFRYYIATKLCSEIKGTKGINLAQLFLGHKNVRSTIGYIKLDVDIYNSNFINLNTQNKFYKNIYKIVEKSNNSNQQRDII